MKKLLLIAALVSSPAWSSTFTTTSPLNGGILLPAGITPVGGAVIDLIGLNGSRLTAEAAASSLFIGNAPGSNPSPVIGTQSGFTAAILNQLGGGIAQAAFRFSLYDGDTASGDFDFNDTTLRVNGIDFGNWSTVQAQNTNGLGVLAGGGLSGGGFRNDTLDTGFFYSTDLAKLAAFYTSLQSTGSVTYGINDVDPGDQYYDFTQGLDASVIGVGSGPVVNPPPSGIPEPSTLGLAGLGLLGLLGSARRRFSKS